MEMAACDARRGQSTLPFDFWDFGTARWQLWNNATSISRSLEEGRFRV
jgi:hypothetical protein